VARPSTAPFSQLGRALHGCLLSVLLLFGLASCSSQESGELVVVVSTDMSLPGDMDWLDWSVTRAGHPDEHGSFALTAFDSLPGTLAIVSGKGDAESVLLRVEGRIGGASGSLRVQREARLTLPSSGQKTLKMPLNWLCSDVNLNATCEPGLTCQAGQCVDSTITEPLADFVPLKSAPCFDTLRCTLNGPYRSQAIPNIDQTTHDCIIDPVSVQPEPLSVALLVNPAVAGNAGVCASNTSDVPSAEDSMPGFCFVPLNRDETPDGWQLVHNAQQQTVIRLPTAVCEAVRLGSVLKVAVTHNDCPAKTSAHPLCEAESTCIVSSSSCPDTFPSSWTGYSCSGAAGPADHDSSLKYCGISDTDPDLGPVERGHFCCTAGQSAAADPLLIDDMSGGPLIKLPHAENQFAGNWFTASDDNTLPISPPQHPQTLFTYRSIPPVKPDGEPSFSSAACFKMEQGFAGYYALEGFSFSTDGVASVPIDVSQFTSITFWAMVKSLGPEPAPPIGVFFPNRDTDTEHSSSCIEAGIKDGTGKTNCNHFRKPLPELSKKWQKFSVTWDKLVQASDFGMHFDSFDPYVYSVDFEALGPGPTGVAPPFDFCVSQIYFTQ
jgi:hypothetical protein